MRATDTAAPRAPQDVRIMIVDDEPAVRSVLARALRREGYMIVDACDGIEALRLLSSSPQAPVHLLITDINMPRLGGLDLARQVRAANWVKHVIFMSGDVEADTTGGDFHSVMLCKPFSLRALSTTVREVLDR